MLVSISPVHVLAIDSVTETAGTVHAALLDHSCSLEKLVNGLGDHK
jgi:hypothetical protein